MNGFRYKLNVGSKKHICPSCGKPRFVRYIDSETGEYLDEKYGRCDRECNCGYHLNPYKTGFKSENPGERENMHQIKSRPQPIVFIPEIVLKATLKHYELNSFIRNLLKLAPPAEIDKIISLYRIGTIYRGSRTGSTTFPFIDKSGNIRAMQVKQFDEMNHTVSTDFIHSLMIRHCMTTGENMPEWLTRYSKNEKFVSCLFGEHLLTRYPSNTVALVEAPKTAIIGTIYYGSPENPANLLWLAVYNKSSLTAEKCNALKGRNVVLFPDLNAFTEWSQKIKELSKNLPGTRFIVSDLLEKNANQADKSKGLDLADYLTRFDYSQFRKLQTGSAHETIVEPDELKSSKLCLESTTISHPIESFAPSVFSPHDKAIASGSDSLPANWNTDIQLVESYFNSIELPQTPVRLDSFSVILNVQAFVSSHLAVAYRYNGNPTFLPYLQRLRQLQHILNQQFDSAGKFLPASTMQPIPKQSSVEQVLD